MEWGCLMEHKDRKAIGLRSWLEAGAGMSTAACLPLVSAVLQEPVLFSLLAEHWLSLPLSLNGRKRLLQLSNGMGPATRKGPGLNIPPGLNSKFHNGDFSPDRISSWPEINHLCVRGVGTWSLEAPVMVWTVDGEFSEKRGVLGS